MGKTLTPEQIQEKEAKKKAAEEARIKAEQEAQLLAEEEARIKAEQEAQLLAEEEARIKTEQEAKDSEIGVYPDKNNVIVEDTSVKYVNEAEKLFSEYGHIDTFSFTSDGLAFFELSDARNHAKTLENKEVITKTRKK